MIFTALDNFYVSKEDLADSPSRKDGISPDVEREQRIYGCEMIQEAGILLRLPQAVMATGQVLLHRFCCKVSLVAHDVKVLCLSVVRLLVSVLVVHRSNMCIAESGNGLRMACYQAGGKSSKDEGAACCFL